MKLIGLSKGLFAQVDDDDYESLNAFRWYATSHKRGYHYAARKLSRKENDGKQLEMKMHWQIMGCKWIDHIDGNTLNNQRCNLRLVNNTQNTHNSNKRRNNTSGYKGVCLHKKT
jgi:hypothetical protein